MDLNNEQVNSDLNMARCAIADLEVKNKQLEDNVNVLSTRLQNALEAISKLEARTLSMEEVKKWTCEYVEKEFDDIHPLKDRWEATDYLPEYDGCIGYYYCPPGTPWYKARENSQIHYNRSEVMKQPEIKLSDM